MLQLLYNFSIHAYSFIISIVAPFNSKAKFWMEGRKNIFERLGSTSLTNHDSDSITNLDSTSLSNPFTERSRGTLAWFHCASLGEFEQGRPVIEAFRAKYPAYKILVTFFSPSGYEIRKNYAGADYIFYLPADTPANARKFIEIVKPSIVFFVKYEFWRNYLTELEGKQIPVVSFSAIFRSNQLFFKPYGGFYREVLTKFRHILVQNQESYDLLESIDIQPITLAGDTRFDRVKQIVDAKKDIQIAEQFKANRQVFMVGSAWQTDMEVLIPLINSFNVGKVLNLADVRVVDEIAFVIAPHEIHREEINAWQKQIELKSICFSEVKPDTQLADYQVLIIDNIGMLSSLYQYANFAFIGGSFGKGLHNILEAATFGMPIFFGNKAYHKFQEAVDLVKQGGAFAVSSTNDLGEILKNLRSNEAKKKETDKISQNYVLQNIGATEKVMTVVASILDN